MAKKAARKQTRAPVAASPTAPEGADTHSKLKAEGDRAFAKKDYNKALASYEAAIKAAPASSAATEIADLRVARAGCFLLLPAKLKEARSECDAALEASPGNLAALARRARANEGLGMFKAALGDVQKALRGVASGTAPGAAELREQEARLKDVVSGKRPASSLMNGGGPSPAGSAASQSVPRGLGGAGLPAANGGGNRGAAAASQQQLEQQRRMQQQALERARAAQLEQARAAQRHFETHVTARIALPSTSSSSSSSGSVKQESSQLVSLNASASLADLLEGIRVKFAKELGISQEELAAEMEAAEAEGGESKAEGSGSSAADKKKKRIKIVWKDAPGGSPVVLRDASDVARAAASYRVRSGAPAAASSGSASASAASAALADPEPLLFDVSFDADAPVPPSAELDLARANRLRALEQQRKLRAMLAEAEREAAAEERKNKAAAAAGGAGGGGGDQGEDEQQQLQYAEAAVEPWVLDFANLFRDKLGVDAERALDFQAFGWDALQAALDDATLDDAAAVPLFEKACDRFSEAAATSLLQWGNVHMHLAHRALLKGFHTCEAAKGADERAKKSARDAASKEADGHFKTAASKYQEADRIRPGYHDTHASVANLEFERAKLAAGLVAPPAKKLDEAEKLEHEKAVEGLSEDEAVALTQAREKAAAEAVNVALHAAMRATLTQNSVRNAEGNMKRAWQSFEKAEAAVPADDRGKKQPQQPADGSPITEEAGPWANIMVMWGNALYEASQMHAAVNLANEKAWRPLLDSAVAKFRDAGCPEADITAALRAHLAAEKLDLPPVEGSEEKEGEEGEGEGEKKKEGGEAAAA